MTIDALPAQELEIIEGNYEALKEYGIGHGIDYYEITEEEIKALRDGKCLASLGEYSTFIMLKTD